MNGADPSSRGSHAWLRSAALFLVAWWAGMAGAAIPAGGYVFLPTAKEAEMYRLIREDGQQRRVQILLDPRICAAARKHAEDTQRRKFFAHLNPDGVNANQRALNEGYPLPANYDLSQNYIESMAGSPADTPAETVALWRSSAPHANHVFGKTDFYRQQVVVGVGHAPASRHGYATYVFISAPLPVGQQGSVTSPGTSGPALAVDATGRVRYLNAQPEAIFEVWKAGPLLTSWHLERCVVVDATGRIDLGIKTTARGIFRLRYLE